MGMSGFLLAVGKKVWHFLLTPIQYTLFLHISGSYSVMSVNPALLRSDAFLSKLSANCTILNIHRSCSHCLQGKRYVLPNTRIMLHHPSGSARGQASDIQNEARELLRIRSYVNKMLAEATGKPIERVS